MSRAEYLERYLSGGSINEKQSKKNKSKSKSKSKHKSKSNDKLPNVIIAQQSLINEQPISDHDEDEIINENPEDEFTPAQVSSVSSTKFKGFKRIDGIEKAPLSSAEQQPTTEKEKEKEISTIASGPPETIYRDSSGKIINLETRRNELLKQKVEEEKSKLEKQESINKGDLDKLEAENFNEKLKDSKSFQVSKADVEFNEFMKSKQRFEDPLQSFTTTTSTPTTGATGRPNYNKGINPNNRFNIKAGYFWDGIDRSNGFEELIMRKRNEINVSKFNNSVNEHYDDFEDI